MLGSFELKRVSRKDRIIGYYLDAESPSHVVILLHGIGEHAARYERIGERFHEAGVAYLSMDLRGHGRSMGPKGHCAPREAILSDIDELIEYAMIRWAGVPIILYGHSMGGNIGLDYRCRGKYNGDLSGYIITSPWLLLVRDVPPALVTALKGVCKVAPRFTVSTKINAPDIRNLKMLAGFPEDPLLHARMSLNTAKDGYLIGKAIADGTHPDNGGAAGIPFLLMAGTADRLCDIEGSRKVAARQPEGSPFEYVEWEGYFHEIHNGNKEVDGEEVIKKAVSFVKSL